jgi:hypothetical protein
MNYGDQFMTCPMCGGLAESDCVDVGVGLYIAGNYHCGKCDWDIDGPVQPELKMDERPFAPVESYDD